MPSFRFASLILVACAIAWPAVADAKTTVKTETYAIAGTTGAALLNAMDRQGPRHGLLARAMAQTRYSVNWKFDWRKANGACRLNAAHATLSIIYRYPELARKVSPDLARRWKAFMSGVRKHEEMHGRIARQMVAATQKSMTRLTSRNDRDCAKAQRKAENIINAVYADYEARQTRFDEKEHRDGGNVDRLLWRLTNEK